MADSDDASRLTVARIRGEELDQVRGGIDVAGWQLALGGAALGAVCFGAGVVCTLHAIGPQIAKAADGLRRKGKPSG
jgi:hypothetical protein